MNGKSPAVHMVYSVGQIFGLSGLAVNVQGKCIGVIGDSGNRRHPIPFIVNNCQFKNGNEKGGSNIPIGTIAAW